MKTVKENPFNGLLVYDNNKTSKGKLLLEFKDGFNLFKLWKFSKGSDACYYVSCFLGKTVICPVCEGDLYPPICIDSYKELHEDSCTISFDDALKTYKKSNPDLTKDWDFGDVYLSLENALAHLVSMISEPKSEYFKRWVKEIGKIQDDIQRKESTTYDKWVTMMEEREPGFTNY